MSPTADEPAPVPEKLEGEKPPEAPYQPGPGESASSWAIRDFIHKAESRRLGPEATKEDPAPTPEAPPPLPPPLLPGATRRPASLDPPVPASGPPSTPTPAPGKKRRWLRRLGRLALVLVVLVVVARIVIVALLPSILDRAARKAGLTCTVERIELSALMGELELSHLVVAPLEGGEPIVALGWLRVDLGLSSLLRGKLVLRRLEVDGLDLLVDRDADGVLALVRRVEHAHTAAIASETVASETPEKPKKPSRSSGGSLPSIVLEAVRVEHVHVHVRDASVTPALDARLDLDVRLSDVVVNALGIRPARLEVVVMCPPVLDSLRIEGEATIAGKDVTAELHVALDRLHLGPLAGYLAHVGIHPIASELSFGLDLTASTRPAATDGIAVLLSLAHVQARADGREVLALDSLGIDAPSVAPGNLDVATVAIAGFRTGAERQPDGALRFLGVELRPGELGTHPTEERAAAPVAEKGDEGDDEKGPDDRGDDAKPPEEKPPETAAKPLPRVTLGTLALTNVRASLHDAAVTPAADLALVLEALHVRNVVLDPARKDVPLDFDLAVAVPGVIEGISVVGSAAPFAARRAVGVSVACTGVTFRALAPYLAKAGIETTLEKGSFELKVEAGARISPAGRIEAEASLRDLVLRDGKRELAAIDVVRASGVKVDLEAASFGVDLLEVARPRISARRDATGALLACGLRVLPSAQPEPAAPTPPGAPAPVAKSRKPPHLVLDRLYVHGVSAYFEDETQATRARLTLADAGIELKGLDTDLDPAAKPPAPASVFAWLVAPGLAEDLRAKGTLVPSARTPSLGLVITGRGITGEAAKPYLEAAGIASHLADGKLDAIVHADASIVKDGPLGASFALEKLRFADGERELFSVEGLRARDARLLPSPSRLERIEVGSVELASLHASARLEPGGSIETLGFSIGKPPRADVAPVASASPPAAPARKGPAPILAVGKIAIGDVSFVLHDATQAPTLDLPIKLGVTVGALSVDLASKAPLEETPYRITLAAPGIVESLVLAGELAASPRNVRLKGALETTGITAASLRGRLAALGIEPLLQEGSFGLELSAQLALDGGVVDASASLQKIIYQDRGHELLGLDAVRVTDVHLGEGKLVLGSIEVERPRVTASREANGAIVAGGFRISPPPPQKELTPAVEPTPAPAKSGKPLVIELRKLRVNAVALGFDDAAVKPRTNVTARLGLRLDELVIGRAAPPANLAILLSVPGALDAFAVDGTLSLDPEDTGAKLALDARGLRAGPLAPYFPPGKALELQDGRFHAALEAGITPCAEGGQAAHVRLTRIDYRDGPTGRPFLKLDELRVLASRLDPAGKIITIDDVSLLGLETRIEKTAEGETRLLGLRLAKPAAVAAVASESVAVAAPVAKAAREKLPLVALKNLHLNVRELQVTDRSKPGAEPLVVSDLHLRSLKPISLLGPDPASQPPIEIELRTQVAPIASAIVVTARLAPFAQDPDVAVTLAIDGLRGAGLTRFAPELAAKLDGAQLTSGRVRAQLTAELRTGRHDVMDFDLSRGFGADLLLKGVEVRNVAPDGSLGPVLAGLDELHVDVARIDSAGNTHIRAIEIQKPAGLVTQETGGMRVLGLLLKKSPAPAAGAPAPVAQEPAAAKPDGAELKIDRISFTDLAFVFRDDSCDPPMVIPLEGLDVTVSQFTTKAFVERRAVRFDTVIKAGKVSLPKREKKDVIPGLGFLLGKLDEVQGAVTGSEKKVEYEERPFFQEIAVSGELSFAPDLEGEITLAIQGLELVNFKGPARAAKIELGGGVVDVTVKARFAGQGDLVSETSVTFTDLDISEQAGGTIQSFLGLKTPLNAVVFVLRNEDGAIEIPLHVDLPHGQITGARIAGELIRVLVTLVNQAVLNSPFRALGQVGDLTKGIVGIVPGSDLLPFMSKPEAKEEPVVIDFAAGDPALTKKELEKLDALAAKVRADEGLVITLRHAIGGGDLAREATNANPSRADRRALLARLASRRADLERQREASSAEARRSIAAGLETEAAAARARLRSLEGEIAGVDKGLDQVYDLERDGADRQADRRTRAACVDLARTRLEALKALLVARGVSEPEERIRLSRPRVDEATGSGGGSVTLTVTPRKKK